MTNKPLESFIPVPSSLYRGENKLRIALVGMPGSGKSTLFKAVQSTSALRGELAGSQHAYGQCVVQIGLDEASLFDLPSLYSLNDPRDEDLVTLKQLLWGDARPTVSQHESKAPAPFAAPDVIVQIIDATALAQQLELSLELSQLARPMVIALNRVDEAWAKGLHISAKKLSKQLGVPVVETVASMGKGIPELFAEAVQVVRQQHCPLPQPFSAHICEALRPLSQAIYDNQLLQDFSVPHSFLLERLAADDAYFVDELQQHFPRQLPELLKLRTEAEKTLPRPLAAELHADRHHQAATLYETVTRLGAPHEGRGWRYWLDEFFLSPRWGLLGSLMVFAIVLFMVFEVSVWLDSITAAKLIDLLADWQPQSTSGVVARAVTDGLIGLVGIVIPYMIPLVLLLEALEQTGVMQRIAFVLDRGFHRIGLHGRVAVPFLLGLGCNVPAISAASRSAEGRDRVVASLLITFVPCSARSAIILALAGKYLGGLGVFAIFISCLVVIAVLGKLLSRRYPDSGPGQLQEIPSYAMPNMKQLLLNTWAKTSDILTIVTPLLVGGSVILALLSHFGADAMINVLLMPVTQWWLGLPLVLGVPILFGILRKELSLLMIYQALGTFDISQHMDWVQITTFLIFVTFYVPCISTFAVMLKTIGRREALFSVFLSVMVALVLSGIVRWPLELVQYWVA